MSVTTPLDREPYAPLVSLMVENTCTTSFIEKCCTFLSQKHPNLDIEALNELVLKMAVAKMEREKVANLSRQVHHEEDQTFTKELQELFQQSNSTTVE